VGEAVPGRGARRAGAEGDRAAGSGGEGRPEAGGGDRAEAGAPGVRDPAHQRRAAQVRGAGGLGERGAADPPRGGAAGGAGAGRAAGASGAAVRAGTAERAVAVGPVHVPAAAPRAAVPGRVHGRPLALHRGARDCAPPAVDAGAGGAGPGDRGVRDAAGDPDGPGSAVHGVAGDDGVRGGVEAAGDPASEVPPPAPADAREDRALLEDALGRVPVENGVRGLRGLLPADRALHRRLQLPAAAPSAGGTRPRGPVLPERAGGARSRGEERPGERGAVGAGEAAAEAVLPGGPAGGPRPVDRGGRGRTAREGGERGADDPDAEGGGR